MVEFGVGLGLVESGGPYGKLKVRSPTSRFDASVIPAKASRLNFELHFRSYDDIVDNCRYARNRLTDQPRTIMSSRLRDWALVGQAQ